MQIRDYLWSVTRDLAVNHGFSLLPDTADNIIDTSSDEQVISLQKRTVKEYLYIRLAPLGYIWPNHISNDLLQMQKVAGQLVEHLHGTKFRMLNLYVFKEPPTTEVAQVLADHQVHKGPKYRIDTGYIDLAGGSDALPPAIFAGTQLRREIFTDPLTLAGQADEESMPASIDPAQVLAELRELESASQQEAADIFNHGKPLVTYAMIAINTLVFLAMMLAGGSTSTEVLLNFGAKESFLIRSGEYWRLITPMFLHIGLVHFLFNNLAIFYLGRVTEKIFGSVRFLLIYLGSGIAGNLVSMIMSPDNIAAGASGAVYGIFGALLYFGYCYPSLFFATVGRDIISILVLNIIIGFTVPNIDFYAHFGGLFGGFLVAALTHLPAGRVKRRLWMTLLAVALVVGLGAASVSAIQADSDGGSAAIYIVGQKALQKGDIERAEEIFSFLVKKYPDEPQFYFFYGNTLLTKGDQAGATELYQQTLEIDGKFPEVYYNLALIELFNERYEGAKDYLKQALTIDSSFQEAQDLIDRIDREMEK